MTIFRSLLTLCIILVLAWAGWNIYALASEFSSDQAATRAIKSRLFEGEHLVPTHRSKELRGQESSDYWCFSDGLCFYPIARFRVLYPAYNDLEDDVLVNEIRGRATP